MKVRAAVSIAVAFMLSTILAGCFGYPETQRHYDPSDGVSVTVGDVRLLNVVVFTEDGEDGNFWATAVNTSDRDIDLTLQYVSGGEKVNIELEVPGSGTVVFGAGENGQLFLPGIDAKPGSLLPIYFQYGAVPGKQVSVPVLDASIPDYAHLLPTPTPTPTPEETEAAEETESSEG